MSRNEGRASLRRRACWVLVLLMNPSSGFSPITQPSSSRPSTRTCGRRRLDTLPLHLMRDDDDGSTTKGPFRRAVGRILRKKRRDESSNEAMHMLTAEQTELADDASTTKNLPNLSTDFILKNFQQTSPSDIFPPTSPAMSPVKQQQQRRVLSLSDVQDAIAKQQRDDSIVVEPSSKTKSLDDDDDKKKTSSNYTGGHFLNRMTRSWLQNFLTTAIERRSQVPPVDLQVRIAPLAVVGRLCRGQFRCDAAIDASRLVFRNIRMTGGRLEAKRMTLNFLGKKPRYSHQFDIHAHNITLTQDDLFESSCIRNGLARLLVRILRNAGVSTSQIQVTSLEIVPSGKISCSGLADTVFGSKVPFEVRSFIDFTSRGHIVQFPGLEVSLGPSLGVFMPVVPNIDLDIGHNARLRSIHVDGRRRRVTLSATTTITPAHTIQLPNYRQAKDSYSAQFSFDVGRWVTKLGNFSSSF